MTLQTRTSDTIRFQDVLNIQCVDHDINLNRARNFIQPFIFRYMNLIVLRDPGLECGRRSHESPSSAAPESVWAPESPSGAGASVGWAAAVSEIMIVSRRVRVGRDGVPGHRAARPGAAVAGRLSLRAGPGPTKMPGPGPGPSGGNLSAGPGGKA